MMMVMNTLFLLEVAITFGFIFYKTFLSTSEKH